MQKYRLDQWCRSAVSGIRFPPDRFPVYRELYGHGEELYESYRAQGLPHREAEAKALEDLGKAEDLIAPLAAIHKPFPGFFLQWSRRTLTVLLVLVAVAFGFFVVENIYLVPAFRQFDGENNYPFAGETKRLLDVSPGTRDSSDGYRFTLSRAVLYEQTLNGEAALQLNLQVQSRRLLPWGEAAAYSSWFWAVDSLGNFYFAAHEDSLENSPAIRVTDYPENLWKTTHDFWLIPYESQGAQWIELHYDRAGRDIVLRLDLEGGGTP